MSLKTMTPEAWAQIREVLAPLEWDGGRFDMTPNSVKITLNRPGPKRKGPKATPGDWGNNWLRYWQAMHLIFPWLFHEMEAQAGDPDKTTENLLAEIERLNVRIRELEANQ